MEEYHNGCVWYTKTLLSVQLVTSVSAPCFNINPNSLLSLGCCQSGHRIPLLYRKLRPSLSRQRKWFAINRGNGGSFFISTLLQDPFLAQAFLQRSWALPKFRMHIHICSSSPPTPPTLPLARRPSQAQSLLSHLVIRGAHDIRISLAWSESLEVLFIGGASEITSATLVRSIHNT